MARQRHTAGDLEASIPISGASFDEGHNPDARLEKPIPNYEGAVFGVRDNAILGWVWDSNRPYEPVGVELYVGDILVGKGNADRFDIELAKANRGNGAHAFELRLDRIPTASPPFAIRAVVAGSEAELHPSITINRLDEVERLVSGSEYAGQVTGIENGVVSGWIYNRRNPHEQPAVTLRDGGLEVVTTSAVEQTSMNIDGGKTANVFRFQLPLPHTVTDGRLHAFSVCVGEAQRELTGSPILFGASDTTSVSRGLVSLFDKLDRLERRIEALQPAWDFPQFETQILKKMLNPVDMLLGVHRDSIEGELAVLRRQLTRLIERVPEMEGDLIAPIKDLPAIQDVIAPSPSAFNVINRALPAAKFDLSAQTSIARLTGGLSWSRSGKLGVLLGGVGAIELDGLSLKRASIAIRGTGGSDIAEFNGIVLGLNGRPMSGRFDIDATGNWSFVGTMIGADEPSTVTGLSINFLQEIAQPSGKLSIAEIAVFPPGRVPPHVDPSAPIATVINLGGDMIGAGWYPVEDSGRGGICWMGARSEVTLKLRLANRYRVTIPEIRPLTPDIMPKLRVFLDGEPVDLEMSPLPGDASSFKLKGLCRPSDTGNEQRTLKMIFPDEYARSPMELGQNADQRPLTMAVRCIAINAE